MMTLKVIFHMADISNGCKSFEISKQWVDLLFVEFFTQGDLERQHDFPISMLMDRVTTNIAKS